MSNDYFTYASPESRYTQARAESVNASFNAVVAGFDKLPTPAEIKQGRVTYGTDSGAANAYVVTMPYTVSSYTEGLTISFKPQNSNTGASTINVDGLGAKAVKAYNGDDLLPQNIVAGSIIELRYNGVDFRLATPQGPRGVNWQGDWSAGTYTQLDAVEHRGSSWICIVASTTDEPTEASSDWDYLAAGFNFRGAWSSSATYAVGDVVTYGDESWRAAEVSTNITPSTGASAWDKLAGAGSVTSVFGRTGAVAAQAGDYDADQIDYDNATSGLSATDVQAAVDEIVAQGVASHTHSISDVTGLQTALDGKAATGHTHADATTSTSGFLSGADKTKLNGIESGAQVNPSGSEVLTQILPVDGSGSGLDADLLDGQHASAFAGASHTHATGDISGLGTAATKNITVSSSSPSGGSNGDLWFQT